MTYIRSKPESRGDAAGLAASAVTMATRREIAREHRQIRAVVAEIEATADLEVLLPRLGELRELLEVHFAREEAPDGLHQVVDGTAPRLATSVQALFAEHREMLALLAGISQRARACLEGPVADVRRSAAELCRRLHEHEAAETDLLAGAVYEDIGGGD
jgi:hypothetical protein